MLDMDFSLLAGMGLITSWNNLAQLRFLLQLQLGRGPHSLSHFNEVRLAPSL